VIGQPVESHSAPKVGGAFRATRPQTSDEFTSRTLGPQWEWNHNPLDSHWSLTERPGYLRLKALPATSLVSARNTLTQVLQARSQQITTKLQVSGMADGQRAGLAMFQRLPGWIGVVQTHGRRELVFAAAGVETTVAAVGGAEFVQLRMQVDAEQAQYAYSLDDGRTFQTAGSRVALSFSWWKGARPALFTYNTDPQVAAGSADFDWVRIQVRP
jgi:beta-xylosidase